MQQRILEYLLAAFQRVGLMPSVTTQQLQQVLTPEMLAHETFLALLAQHYFPEHCVSYDTEHISSKEDLMNLVTLFAKATVGEWMLDALRATWEGPEATVSFEFDENRHTLTFEQDSEWVNLEFYEQIGQFARYNLSGDFVNIPTNRRNEITNEKCSLHVYLPRVISMEVAFLMLLDNQEYMDVDMMLDIYGLLQRYGLLVNVVTLDQQLRINVYDLSSFLEALLIDDQLEFQIGVQHLLHYAKSTQKYDYVLRELARLTKDEWKPENLKNSYNEQNEETTLQFDSFKHHFLWKLSWKPVGLEQFHHNLQSFAAEYLRNDYARLPLDDEYEYSLYLYIPKAASQELTQILARGPLVGPQKR